MAETPPEGSLPHTHCLKLFKEDASLNSTERLFQDMAPVNEDIAPLLNQCLVFMTQKDYRILHNLGLLVLTN